MPIKVMIVDDSAFFRRRIKEILEKSPELTVVGGADNGRDAIDRAKELNPDVITMDYEMPVMDGITAVREIMRTHPTPILMFSSLSFEGARVTLDALDAGALDYLPKSFESMTNSPNEGVKLLQDKVIAIARKSNVRPAPPAPAAPTTPARSRPIAPPAPSSTPRSSQAGRPNIKPRVVLIGASTGGPVALQKTLADLPANFPYPILLIQHMPNTFTSAFAQRLDRICNIRVQEAVDGDALKPGVALLAPGGTQMLLGDTGRTINVIEGSPRLQYKPSVDVTFGSAARSLKGQVLALVLTGMGHDGREGCKLLKREGATVWTQDEQSCVVYGMPMSVQTAGLSDMDFSLDNVCAKLGAI
ncbi:chemotaxis response regulator protein-glutamate methylesterase [Gammaproteobacteria bacterium 42_54_T18]|nr:chemotaxis response regulator protein-glutamate methylesterase [Gammaproteobacteria bacterium 42_54_T18]